MKAIILICILLILSCNNFRNIEASKDFRTLINKIKRLDTNSLRFNGVYSLKLKKKEKRNIQSPIYFFKNGLILYDEVIGDSTEHSQSIISMPMVYVGKGYNWGTYDVTNGNIEAIIFCKVSTSRQELFKYYEFHFSGKIFNENTIINWRLVEPYPALNQRYNKDLIAYYTIPQTLIFHSLPAKEKIDANKAWINEFITN